MARLEKIISIAEVYAKKGKPLIPDILAIAAKKKINVKDYHQLEDYFPPESITPYAELSAQDKEYLKIHPPSHIATISSVKYKQGKHYYRLLLPDDPNQMAGTFYYDKGEKQFYVDVEQLVSKLIEDAANVPFNERYIIAKTRTGKNHYKLAIYKRNLNGSNADAIGAGIAAFAGLDIGEEDDKLELCADVDGGGEGSKNDN